MKCSTSIHTAISRYLGNGWRGGGGGKGGRDEVHLPTKVKCILPSLVLLGLRA